MTSLSEQFAPPGGWHPAAVSRIAPIDLRGSGPRARLLAWALGLFVKGDPPAVFLVLMRHWRLFRAWLSFAARLMPFGKLDRRDTELAILRVGWLCRCRYEWGQHVAIGLRVGLTPRQIASVAQGADAPDWEPRQAALLRGGGRTAGASHPVAADLGCPGRALRREETAGAGAADRPLPDAGRPAQ